MFATIIVFNQPLILFSALTGETHLDADFTTHHSENRISNVAGDHGTPGRSGTPKIPRLSKPPGVAGVSDGVSDGKFSMF